MAKNDCEPMSTMILVGNTEVGKSLYLAVVYEKLKKGIFIDNMKFSVRINDALEERLTELEEEIKNPNSNKGPLATKYKRNYNVSFTMDNRIMATIKFIDIRGGDTIQDNGGVLNDVAESDGAIMVFSCEQLAQSTESQMIDEFERVWQLTPYVEKIGTLFTKYDLVNDPDNPSVNNQRRIIDQYRTYKNKSDSKLTVFSSSNKRYSNLLNLAPIYNSLLITMGKKTGSPFDRKYKILKKYLEEEITKELAREKKMEVSI